MPAGLEISLGHLVTKIDAERAGSMVDQGADRIVLAMPPTADIEQAKDILSACAQRLSLRLVSILPVADRAALSDVVHRYAAGVDDRQFDSVAKLFTVTAELTLPDPPAALTRSIPIGVRSPSPRPSPRLPRRCVPSTRSSVRSTTKACGPAARAGASRASRITGMNARTRFWMWSGICATTTNMS